ncbi:hypothetical protein DPMN_029590 [Dreissena polymorpha]|uniref:Uncharacterized protein n=1 Tax=Dreissena polymorpha TaxID=45954 RepID=A0A9D4LYG1_DREPO|nr:hypothetical protein DPMN_029590 [Dreissena polymorpha]
MILLQARALPCRRCGLLTKQRATAALLRQAAELLNVNTSDRSTQYQHLHQYPVSKEAWTSKYRNCGSARTGLLYPGVIRSLVTTNDHLLKELDETRERHQYRGESY